MSPPSPQSLPSGQAEPFLSENLLAGSESMQGAMLDELLLNAMDKAVLRFAEIMSDHSTLTNVHRDGTTTETMKYSFTEKMKAAEFVRDWIGRRRKLATANDVPSDAPNIDELRAAVREETLKTLEKNNLLKAPPRRVGRPTKAEVAERELQAYREKEEEARRIAESESFGDDSELQKTLKGSL